MDLEHVDKLLKAFAQVFVEVVLCLFLVDFDTSYLEIGKDAIISEDLFSSDFIINLTEVADVL